MKVKAWSNGRGTYGVRVGAKNREEYFKKQWSGIVVEVAGIPRNFRLTRGFWKDCPEFRDVGARWLEAEFQLCGLLPWHPYRPPSFTLIPTGEARFKLVRGQHARD